MRSRQEAFESADFPHSGLGRIEKLPNVLKRPGAHCHSCMPVTLSKPMLQVAKVTLTPLLKDCIRGREFV